MSCRAIVIEQLPRCNVNLQTQDSTMNFAHNSHKIARPIVTMQQNIAAYQLTVRKNNKARNPRAFQRLTKAYCI